MEEAVSAGQALAATPSPNVRSLVRNINGCAIQCRETLRSVLIQLNTGYELSPPEVVEAASMDNLAADLEFLLQLVVSCGEAASSVSREVVGDGG